MSNRNKTVKVVIPAAAFGTRLLHTTQVMTKEMLPVAGKPLIQHAIGEPAASGIEIVPVVVREPNSFIQNAFCHRS